VCGENNTATNLTFIISMPIQLQLQNERNIEFIEILTDAGHKSQDMNRKKQEINLKNNERSIMIFMDEKLNHLLSYNTIGKVFFYGRPKK